MAKKQKGGLFAQVKQKFLSNKALYIVALVSVIVGTVGFALMQTNMGKTAFAALNCPAGFSPSGSSCVKDTPRVCPEGIVPDGNGNCVKQVQVGYQSPSVPTQNQAVTNTTTGWTLIPGTIYNIWGGAGTGVGPVQLSDSLYNNENGIFSAAPSAGYYGQANNLSVGLAAIPRVDNFQFISCERYINGETRPDRYAADFHGSENDDDFQCTFANATTEPNSLKTLDIRNQNWINWSQCRRDWINTNSTADERHIGVFPTVTQTQQLSGLDSCGGAGYIADGWDGADITNYRYVTTTVCGRTVNQIGNLTNQREFKNFIKGTNTGGDYPDCGGFYANPVVTATHYADLYDTTKSPNGTMQYQVYQASSCSAAEAGGSKVAISASACRETITASSYTPGITEIGNCTPSPASVEIGTAVNCTFTLSGAPSGVNYDIPAGTTASISTASGSAACSASGSTLTCSGIPTTGGTAGTQNINLTLGGGTATDKGDITLTAVPVPPTTITPTNIGTSSDCTSTKNVAIPNTYICNFPLTGATDNNYALPTNGITASTSTATGQSPACTITGNGTASAALNCTGIPTTDGTPGAQNVLLTVNGATPAVDKGDVNLSPAPVPTTPPTTITLTNIGTSSDCTSVAEVIVGTNYTCNFPLTGATDNNYALPTNGIKAWTATDTTGTTPLANSSSDACSITGNGTSSAALRCANIKTTNSTTGVKNVLIQVETGTPTDKGDVFVVENDAVNVTTITPTNIGTSTNCTSSMTVTIGNTYSCSFPLTGDSGNNYLLPTNGITASTSTATGQSPACTITGNGTASAALSCTSIPSTGGAEGQQNVLLTVNGVTPAVDKGDVNLVTGSIPVETCTSGQVNSNSGCTTVVTPTNIGNSTDCTSTKNVTIPQSYSCTFPLTGSPNNNYQVPTGSIAATTSTDGGSNTTPVTGDPSYSCSIQQNGTTNASLLCMNIPSANGTAGTRNVLLTVSGGTPTDKGDVNLTNTPNGDKDNDGIPDPIECPTSTSCPDTDNDGVTNDSDIDSDQDGIPDIIEKGSTCATLTNCDPVDTDGDGVDDYIDTDSDNDGIPDYNEKGYTCMNTTTCSPLDSDNDGIPDYRDADSDNDLIPDTVEKGSTCATLANCNPVDTDGDGKADYTDKDSDADSIPDYDEAGNTCVQGQDCTTLVTTPRDTDGDGKADYIDADSDNDGIPDSVEARPSNTRPVSYEDTDKDGTPDYRDTDSDGDGIPDSYEKSCSIGRTSFLIPTALAQSNVSLTITPCDTDKDGTPDYRDTDSDQDGLSDSTEKGSSCASLTACTPKDSNNNGIPDFREKLESVLPRTGGWEILATTSLVIGVLGLSLFVAQRQRSKLGKKVDLK